MKKILFLLLVSANTFVNGQKIYECIKDKSYKIEDNNYVFLKDILANKQIIILGEVGHGDGTTFEKKAKLIQYLQKELGYNTIALEGGGVWEIPYALHEVKKGKDFKIELSKSWFDVWTNCKQTELFTSFLEQNLNYIDIIGIEPQPFNIYSTSIGKAVESVFGTGVMGGIDTSFFNRNLLLYFYSHFDTAYKADIPALEKDLSTLEENLIKINNSEKDVYLQGITNFKAAMKFLELVKGNWEKQNEGINLRDKIMADNILWYLQKNSKAKIIIWTANFHAAKNLHQAVYKEDDNFYQVMTPLGQRLYETLSDKVYSIAFTSYDGETAMYYSPESYTIESPENTLEYEINDKFTDSNLFIDFSAVRKDTACSSKRFSSIMLGYDSKTGNWFNIFDGLFFIKTMGRCEKN